MKSLSFVLIILGSLIMIISIFNFYKILLSRKLETYNSSQTNATIFQLFLTLMYMFLAGYIAVAVMLYKSPKISYAEIITAIVFFFGSIFVLTMIAVQKKMNRSISEKTLEVMKTLVNVIEMKDIYTKGHSQHVYKIVELFFEYLPVKEKKQINKAKLLDAALLHDIGKVSIPDAVLNKEGALNEFEWELMKSHPKNGKIILDDTSFKEISDWVFYHHERIDGNGYMGLSGEKIPIEAKIISVADTFSALFTNRIYRPKFPFEKAMLIIKESAGTQLDEELVNIFITIPEEEFLEIGREIGV